MGISALYQKGREMPKKLLFERLLESFVKRFQDTLETIVIPGILICISIIVLSITMLIYHYHPIFDYLLIIPLVPLAYLMTFLLKLADPEFNKNGGNTNGLQRE